jgi:hypothetical protein
MGLHQCGDVKSRQLYPQGVRQIYDLESQPSSVSMKGRPTVHCHDGTIFSIGYFPGQELQALL